MIDAPKQEICQTPVVRNTRLAKRAFPNHNTAATSVGIHSTACPVKYAAYTDTTRCKQY